MFTGIVEGLGEVVAIGTAERTTPVRLELAVGAVAEGVEVGDSIAVNGVCLTVVSRHSDRLGLDVVPETLRRTNLGRLRPGDLVDLERPLAVGARFDGHIVQGHVDGVGTVLEDRWEGDSRVLRVSVPDRLDRYVVEKGSVTVDGVSLTITAVAPAGEPGWFEVALIPHTLEVTVLGSRQNGDQVNLEVDVIAKYVERMVEGRT